MLVNYFVSPYIFFYIPKILYVVFAVPQSGCILFMSLIEFDSDMIFRCSVKGSSQGGIKYDLFVQLFEFFKANES